VSPQHREDPPEARRYVWLWVVVLVLLAGATLYLRHAPEPTDEDLAELGLGPSPSASPSPTKPTETALQQPGEEASELTSRLEVPDTCWSGDVAPTLADCPPFTGDASLRYVFPGLETASGCLSQVPAPPKLTVVQCPVEVDGTQAEVTYSEFTDHQSLLDHYAEEYGGGPSGRSGDLDLYGPAQVGSGGRWQGTATYADGGRWSVSFRGVDQARTRAVLDTLKVRQWRVVVASVDPRSLDQTDSNDP
jgi:hypothetical protein